MCSFSIRPDAVAQETKTKQKKTPSNSTKIKNVHSPTSTIAKPKKFNVCMTTAALRVANNPALELRAMQRFKQA